MFFVNVILTTAYVSVSQPPFNPGVSPTPKQVLIPGKRSANTRNHQCAYWSFGGVNRMHSCSGEFMRVPFRPKRACCALSVSAIIRERLLETDRQYYEMALEKEPDYALVFAGIAQVWAGLQQMSLVPPHEAGPQARAAALRALELDSTLVEVQYTLAGLKTWVDWDWSGAETAFRCAIDLNPNFPDVRACYSHFLLTMHRPDEAVPQMERAVELDPFNPLLLGLHGAVLYMVRRYDEAIALYQDVLRTVPNHPLVLAGLQLVYHAKGMYEEALAAASSF